MKTKVKAQLFLRGAIEGVSKLTHSQRSILVDRSLNLPLLLLKRGHGRGDVREGEVLSFLSYHSAF